MCVSLQFGSHSYSTPSLFLSLQVSLTLMDYTPEIPDAAREKGTDNEAAAEAGAPPAGLACVFAECRRHFPCRRRGDCSGIFFFVLFLWVLPPTRRVNNFFLFFFLGQLPQASRKLDLHSAVAKHLACPQ